MPGKTMHKSLIFGINSFENFKTFWQKKNFPRPCSTSWLRTAHQQGMFVEQIVGTKIGGDGGVQQ